MIFGRTLIYTAYDQENGNRLKKALIMVKMKAKELNTNKVPVVRIDSSLEKYKDKVLFKGKLEKANEVLKMTGLPKSGRQHS